MAVDGCVIQKVSATDAGIEIWLGSLQAAASNQPIRIYSAAGLVVGGFGAAGGSFGSQNAVQSVTTTPTTLDRSKGIILCDATAGAITLNLPAANIGAGSFPLGATFGNIFYIKKIDVSANAVTITRAGADTIEGANTLVLAAQWDKVVLVSDGVSLWTKF
jgi:hypothetical protein